jgi:hypothetical protein
MKIKIISLNFVLLACLLFGMAGCAVTDVDRKVDFSRYRTFAWGESDIKIQNPVYNSGLINKNIKTTVENEFAKRGITLDRKHPDLVVSYHTYTENKQHVSAANNAYPFYGGYGFYPRFYGYGFGWGMPYYGGYSSMNYPYTEGTLIIDIADSRTDEVIWRGTVSGNVDNIKKLERQIEKGIKAIMKKYPAVPADQEKLKLPEKNAIG